MKARDNWIVTVWHDAGGIMVERADLTWRGQRPMVQPFLTCARTPDDWRRFYDGPSMSHMTDHWLPLGDEIAEDRFLIQAHNARHAVAKVLIGHYSVAATAVLSRFGFPEVCLRWWSGDDLLSVLRHNKAQGTWELTDHEPLRFVFRAVRETSERPS